MLRLAVLSLLLSVAFALENGEAVTPPLGWRSWNAFLLDVDQAKMTAQVDAVVAPGPNGGKSLADLGFGRIGLDDGWQACGAGEHGGFHDAGGRPIVNVTRFPNMRQMVDDAHAKGVKMGFYLNNCWCCETGHESGHVPEDIVYTFEQNFDEVKIDGCGPAHNITEWAAAINRGPYPLLVENCGDNHRTWSPPLPSEVLASCPYNFFRVSSDIAPDFYSAMYNLQFMIPFLDRATPASRPGCWAYPDMLQVGNRLTLAESKSHFAAWAIVSAPLILGFDLTDTKLYDTVYSVISNEIALEINQAYYSHPGYLAAAANSTFSAPTPHGAGCDCCDEPSKCEHYSFSDWQVWTKPLGSNRHAVLAINLSNSPVSLDIPLSLFSLSKANAMDVWTQKVTVVADRIKVVDLAAHDNIFLVLTAA